MYKFQKSITKTSNCVVLTNTDQSNKLVINLNEGARVNLYKHKGNPIISDLKNSSYSSSYAGAILFPFANRVKDGKYAFNNKNYELICNEPVNNNAIHGLVYNKVFSILDFEEKDNSVSVVLNYKEDDYTDGFPFKYSISVTYILSDQGLKLRIHIKNEGKHTFPFTLGWHPYFMSCDISQSQLILNSVKQFTTDTRGIVNEDGQTDHTSRFVLGGIQLDDGYAVASDMLEFITPRYHLKMQTDGSDNYLQVYTPEELNSIAIEPMVGISNSFNHRIGLKELKPNQTFDKEWSLEISSFEDNR